MLSSVCRERNIAKLLLSDTEKKKNWSKFANVSCKDDLEYEYLQSQKTMTLEYFCNIV